MPQKGKLAKCIHAQKENKMKTEKTDLQNGFGMWVAINPVDNRRKQCIRDMKKLKRINPKLYHEKYDFQNESQDTGTGIFH